MITKEQYLANPCRASSIPYWKAKTMSIPKEMKIIHNDDFSEAEYQQFDDEPYFRLIHSLQELSAPLIPEGFLLCDGTLMDYADHINKCYDNICISELELRSYTTRPVYSAKLWLAIKDKCNEEIVATGIAELDREIGEGILEWIQVSKDYRGCGLGSYIVSELLWRMKDIAKFATVSGQCNNPTNPEGLYRKCVFIGNDVWHILRKRELL